MSRICLGLLPALLLVSGCTPSRPLPRDLSGLLSKSESEFKSRMDEDGIPLKDSRPSFDPSSERDNQRITSGMWPEWRKRATTYDYEYQLESGAAGGSSVPLIVTETIQVADGMVRSVEQDIEVKDYEDQDQGEATQTIVAMEPVMTQMFSERHGSPSCSERPFPEKSLCRWSGIEMSTMLMSPRVLITYR